MSNKCKYFDDCNRIEKRKNPCMMGGAEWCEIFKQKKLDECPYNYHQDEHEDVCHFECMLDGFLEPDSQLTQDAQEYRDKLIIGVERMMKKVEDYKTTQ